MNSAPAAIDCRVVASHCRLTSVHDDRCGRCIRAFHFIQTQSEVWLCLSCVSAHANSISVIFKSGCAFRQQSKMHVTMLTLAMVLHTTIALSLTPAFLTQAFWLVHSGPHLCNMLQCMTNAIRDCRCLEQNGKICCS